MLIQVLLREQTSQQRAAQSACYQQQANEKRCGKRAQDRLSLLRRYAGDILTNHCRPSPSEN
jgi:hypothetical protein